jgi:peptidoglycan/LPS O-acetylase OafA/YrhL
VSEISPAQSAARTKRIPSLDGLRAISICLVLFGHLRGTRGFPVLEFGFGSLNLAHFGVTVFFVISGLLITRLLIEEYHRHGTINLVHFYVRRGFRIFPAYFAFILVAIAGFNWGWISLKPADLTAALTYTMNYHPDRAWHLGHTWSLAVEEQFYLIWPLALLILGLRRGFISAAMFAIATPFLRFGLWWFASLPYPKAIIGESFETAADAIAVGCVLAGTRDWLWSQAVYRRILSSRLFAAVPLLGLLCLSTGSHPMVWAFSYSIAIVAIGLGIDWCVRFPVSSVGKLLNSRPLVYIGGLSYSIYLWQQPFLNRASATSYTSFPLNLVFTALAAITSYYLIEAPGLRLRDLVESRWRSRGSDFKQPEIAAQLSCAAHPVRVCLESQPVAGELGSA